MKSIHDAGRIVKERFSVDDEGFQPDQEQKTAATSVASPATSKVLHQDDVAANPILADDTTAVKDQSGKAERFSVDEDTGTE